MRIFYSDTYPLPLPEGHRFPIEKYTFLRQRVIAAGLVSLDDLIVGQAACDEELVRAHNPEYLRQVKTGQLSPQEIRRIGFPWSAELVERSRRSVGCTLAASRSALEDGLAVSLSGGTHHAGRDYGQGYCVFNDSAVAARAMQTERRAHRVLILDCDVHQGNGTADIFSGDPTVFTFSIHGARNFPYTKVPSNLDIALDDETGDAAYLEALKRGVQQSLEMAKADFVIFLAGADPYVGDRLGRLALSKEGLAKRDRIVLNACWSAGLPVAITMAGGYAKQITDTVDIHFQTVQIAADMVKFR